MHCVHACVTVLQAGMGKAVEWSLNMMTTGAMKLRELERTAKQNKAGIWRNYVPQVRLERSSGCSVLATNIPACAASASCTWTNC